MVHDERDHEEGLRYIRNGLEAESLSAKDMNQRKRLGVKATNQTANRIPRDASSVIIRGIVVEDLPK
jgi:hypothetical protein